MARDYCLYGHHHVASHSGGRSVSEGGVCEQKGEVEEEEEDPEEEESLVLLDCDSTSKFRKRFLHSQFLCNLVEDSLGMRVVVIVMVDGLVMDSWSFFVFEFGTLTTFRRSVGQGTNLRNFCRQYFTMRKIGVGTLKTKKRRRNF